MMGTEYELVSRFTLGWFFIAKAENLLRIFSPIKSKTPPNVTSIVMLFNGF